MHKLINTQHRSVCWREPCPPLYTSQHTDAVLQCAPQMCSHNRTPRLSGSKSDGPAARTSSCCSERTGTLLLLLLCKRLHGMRPEAAGVLGAAGTGKGYSKTPFEPRLSKKKTLREAWGATDDSASVGEKAYCKEAATRRTDECHATPAMTAGRTCLSSLISWPFHVLTASHDEVSPSAQRVPSRNQRPFAEPDFSATGNGQGRAGCVHVCLHITHH